MIRKLKFGMLRPQNRTWWIPSPTTDLQSLVKALQQVINVIIPVM
jgi:hypothetical protein